MQKALLIVILVLAGGIFLRAETLNTEGGFYLDLPDKWVQVPQSLLAEWAAESQRLMPKMRLKAPQFAYQPKPFGGEWLTYPYCLGFISRAGRPRESEFVQFAKNDVSALLSEASSTAKEKSDGHLEDASFGRSIYDAQKHILWSPLSVSNAGTTSSDRHAKGMVARVLTSEGGITLRFYCAESDFDALFPQFRSMVESIRLPPELRYSPTFIETLSWFQRLLALGAIFVGALILGARLAHKPKLSDQSPPQSKAEYHDLLQTILPPLPIAPPPVVPPAPGLEPITLTDSDRKLLYNRRSNAFVIDMLIGTVIPIGACYVGVLLGLGDTALLFLFVLFPLIGSAYLLLKDALPNGRSLGKRLFDLRTVQVNTRLPCGALCSIARNLILWLWILGPFVGLVVIVILCTNFFPDRPGAVPISSMAGLIFYFSILPVIRTERSMIRDDVHGQNRTDKWTGTQVIFSNGRNA